MTPTDSHLDGSKEEPTDASVASYNLRQGNDARLQLVPASTTAGVNGLDSKHELVALQTTGVRLAETTSTREQQE
jgi:hypothetical protein